MQKTAYGKTNGRSLLSIVKAKSANGKNAIDLNVVLGCGTENVGFIKSRYKNLFELFAEGLIDIEPHGRNKFNHHIIYRQAEINRQAGDPQQAWHKISEWVIAYLRIGKQPALDDFIELTGNRLGGHELFSFLKKINADIRELEILLKAIAGFYTGQHPVFLADMTFNPVEMACHAGRLLDGESILLSQDLIRTTLDMDGVTCRISITKRTLQLAQNKSVPMLSRASCMSMGLFTYKRHETLPEKNLCFNDVVSGNFEIVHRLVKRAWNDLPANISVLLYGPSGTGKTEFAYQLAKNTRADIMQVNYAQIHSKWIGETEKNIRKVFAEYGEKCRNAAHPVILLLNEADGLMNRRVNIHTSNDVFANHAQSQMLEELESFKGVLVATTNLYQNIDEAFHRRFLFRCFVDYPDRDTRNRLLKQSSIGKYLPDEVIEKLRDSRWTAAQLQNFERKLSHFALLQPLSRKGAMAMMEHEGLIQHTRKIGFR